MRYILKISYTGKNYSGFQIQKDKDTVQSHIEKVLSHVCKEDIKIVASGRTDAGVSAICQVCHFDTSTPIIAHKVLSYANVLLPDDIRILDILDADNDFHARFSAKRKTYEYYFYVGMVNAYYEQFAVHVARELDIESMIKGAQLFEGKKDFSSFCASNTDVKDKIRTIYSCQVNTVNDNLYKLTICGNGFLYNMVRIIMGTLVGIGLGKIGVDNLPAIINAKDRNCAGKTMPSKGLVLKNVEY